MKKRGSLDFLNDILTSVDKALSFTKNKTLEDFNNDKQLEYAVIRCLEIIGEAANRIPRTIKSKYTDVPWKDMITMRNKVIHEYFGVNSEILWKTIESDILPLKSSIKTVIDDIKNNPPKL